MTTIEQQKENKKLAQKQRHSLQSTTSRIRLWFSIGKIKTWADLGSAFGYAMDYSKTQFGDKYKIPVTFPEINEYCAKLSDELEARLNPPPEPVKQDITPPLLVIDGHTHVLDLGMREPVVLAPPKQLLSTGSAPSSTDESGYTNDNNYGLVVSEKEKAFLYYFQKKCAAEILQKVVLEKKRAVLAIAATGTGKTFIKAAVLRRLIDQLFEKDKTWGITSYLNITRSSVVEQDRRVLQNHFDILHPSDTETINIEQLRSRAGELWVKRRRVIIDGEDKEVWEWKPMINPCVITLDECQAVRNEDSTQHKILCAFSKINTPTTQIFISATPFTRVSEAKCFAIATRKDISHITGLPGSTLTESTWPTYASYMADPTGASKGVPTDYNEAAVERLMTDLNDYIVRVKGVKWQFNAINKTEVIDFEPPSSENDFTDTKAEYALAWETYLIEMEKLQREVTDNPRFQALVKLNKFLIAAEYAKRYIFASRMIEDCKNGYAAILGCKQKKTIIAVVKILNQKYGIPRNKISLIWGGGQTQLSAKQKLKAAVREQEDKFKEQGITMEDLLLDEVEDRVLENLPEELRLGSQSKEERQKEIDRFQGGVSDFCIFTFKSGGVGLSLHHTDELTNSWNESAPGFKEWLEKDIKNWNRCKPEHKRVKPGKVRKQNNGYAYTEDIPFITTKPRKTTISPTWSPIELVQAVGRPARLTSLSNTEQTLIGFRNTVEEEQLFVVTHRLKCLSKVVRQRENWADLIRVRMEGKDTKKAAEELLENNKLTEDTSDEAVSVGEDEEREEE